MPVSAPLPSLTLVLGGQRSGKSAFAEGLIGPDRGAVYLATCRIEASDAAMAARIRDHQNRRGDWATVEEPVHLPAALLAANAPDRPVLVDSLGMWVTNLLLDGCDIETETTALISAFGEMQAPVVMVSEETGLGVIPVNDLAARFVDALGTLNQQVARMADRVVLVTAGIGQTIKG